MPYANPQDKKAQSQASTGGGARRRPVTIRTLQQAKAAGRKITMVTAYDATFARLVEMAGVDMILVGDSLGNVVQGHRTTLPVTVDHMVYHTAAVTRGATTPHVVADLPFMSYQAGEDDAVRNAGRLMAEGGANSVKLEGGKLFAPLVRRLVSVGIPVMGHLGLTPQSVHQLGGFRVQGRGKEAGDTLLEDALALQEAGAYALVLEMVPEALGKRVSEALDIPTIGIGAGPHTDGQVLVIYDLLGMNQDFSPKFLKRFAHLEDTIVGALQDYNSEVQQGAFPAPEHSFTD